MKSTEPTRRSGDPSVDVTVPFLGEAVSTAVLVAWYVEVGERACRGEPLYEIGTEKTVFQVDAELDGVLCEVLVGNGEEVEPGRVVGRLRPA